MENRSINGLLGLLLCLNVTLALTLEKASNIHELDWEEYKRAYGKTYDKSEDADRRIIWAESLKYINNHNREANKGDHSYRLGMNQFGDLTKEERKERTKAILLSETGSFCTDKPSYSHHGDLPPEVNYTKQGVVTPVKDQKMCGSPWAFSATGALESRNALYCPERKLVSLSEQNLIDCSFAEGNQGCNGGLMDWSFKYIVKNHGIDTEASYPYEAKNGKCRFNPQNIGAKMRNCVDLQKGNETALEVIVAITGPVSIGIRSDLQSFEFYKSGVYDDPKCTDDQIDHAALIVGYGTMQNKQYWLIKNSWGTSWGMDGYILLARNHGNRCGVASLASYPEMLCNAPF